MSLARTFTVTVANPGSGNRYYLDGVLQATAFLAVSGTYRFDQSDSSNAGHPLRFSNNANNDPNDPYTIGVTTNGTPGSAGAYTEIDVTTSTPATLYYYCQIHYGMGGSISISGNAWGAFSWNKGAWNQLNDESVAITGQQLNLSAGTASVFEGLGNVISITGFSLGVSVNDGRGWSRESWSEGNWNSPIGNIVAGSGTIFIEDGQSLTSSVNDSTVIGSSQISINPNALSINVGSIGAGSGAVVSATGSELTTTVNTFAVTANGAITINTPTLEANTALGTVATGTANVIDITGQQLQSNLGTISIDSENLINITGFELTSTVNTISLSTEQILSISGNQANVDLATIIPDSENFISINGNRANINVTSLKFWDPIQPTITEEWTNIH